MAWSSATDPAVSAMSRWSALTIRGWLLTGMDAASSSTGMHMADTPTMPVLTTITALTTAVTTGVITTTGHTYTAIGRRISIHLSIMAGLITPGLLLCLTRGVGDPRHGMATTAPTSNLIPYTPAPHIGSPITPLERVSPRPTQRAQRAPRQS